MSKRDRDKKRNKRRIQEKNRLSHGEEEREIVSEAIEGLEKVVSKPISETETSTHSPLSKVGGYDNYSSQLTDR